MRLGLILAPHPAHARDLTSGLWHARKMLHHCAPFPVLGLLRQSIILAQARFELAVYLSLPDVLLEVLGAPDIVSLIREGKLSAHP